jgi:hypothetical protein
MSDMHFHCQACKQFQWLDENAPHCSYCGSTRLWEIVEKDCEDEYTERDDSAYRRDMILSGRGHLLK